MNQIFIDTSNRFLYIAIIQNGKTILEHLQEGNNNHSEMLVDVLKKCLKEVKLTVDELNQIYVGRGPGSYTGVRVACTVAKVLAYAKKITLYSFSSLDLLLSNYLGVDGDYVVSMDARRGFTYAEVVTIKDNKLIHIEKENFVERTILEEKYQDYTWILQDDTKYQVNKLLEYGLVKEEKNIHAFVPTYLRSGV